MKGVVVMNVNQELLKNHDNTDVTGFVSAIHLAKPGTHISYSMREFIKMISEHEDVKLK